MKCAALAWLPARGNVTKLWSKLALIFLWCFVAFLAATVIPGATQPVQYVGDFTNTTVNRGGAVIIHLAFGGTDGNEVTGRIDFTEYPGTLPLCGAGDFTGTLQENTLEVSFVSNDPDAGCSFDRGSVFTIRATVSPDRETIAGEYATSLGQQGVFDAGRGRFPGALGKAGVDGCAVTGDPVTLTNGNHFQQAEDIRLPGPGVPFRFARTYNSRSDQTGPLGFGWSHNFAVWLVRHADGTIAQTSGDGASVLFTPTGTGTYASTSPPGLFRTLTETPGGLSLRHKDGLTLEFPLAAPDQPAQLSIIRDRNGNTQTLAYDAAGLLTSVTDSFGKSLNFGYAEGRITSVTDMTGRVWAYAYDGDGNLASVTTPADASTPPATTAYTYYRDGFNAHNLEAIMDPRGERRRFLYHASDQLAQEIDTTRAVTAYHYDHAALQTRAIDSRGFERLFTYNAEGLVLSIQEPDGTATHFTWGPDANGPAGTRTSVTNRLGQTTTLTYDASGNLTVLLDPLGGATRFAYEPVFNQVTQITDPAGHVTTIAYDAQGNPVTLTDPLGGMWIFVYDSRGLLLKQTDVNGNSTAFAYDARGLLETLTDAAGSVTRLARDAVGRVTAVTEGAGSPEERTRTFTYDALGRLLSATDGNGAATQFRYDEAGNLTEVENATGQIVERRYDAMNRVVRLEDPLRGATQLDYDLSGNLVRTVESGIRTTTFAYDARNRLILITDDAKGETHITYDAQGNAVALQDALGQTTAFAYDTLDRLIQRTNPLGQSTAFTYDARSNLLTRTNPNGQVVSYTYDALSRLVGTVTPDNEQVLLYDAAGNVLTVDDHDSGLRFTYDALHRVTAAETVDAGGQPAVTLAYVYDALGNRRQLLDGADGATQFAYDAESRLTQLITPAGDSIGLTYDAAGRPATLLFPNRVDTQLAYDAQGRLSRLTHSAGGTALADIAYDYNGLGNIRSSDDPAQQRTFGYDGLQQLTRSNRVGSSQETYTYDAVGNRVTSHLSAAHVYDAANRLLEDDQFTYSYDANGNLAAKTAKATGAVTRYGFDAQNQLIRIDFPDGTFAAYRYDGLGRRIEKNVNGAITRYVYDGEDIALEYDGNGVLLARYNHGDRTDQPLSMERGGQRYFYHTDHLGSVRAVTDAAGAAVNTYDYDGFGQFENAVEGVPNPYAFTGREQDAESELYYYRARYYCPRVGKFISEDPLGFDAGDMNLYRYVFNNPVNFTDPSGEILPALLVGAFIGAGIDLAFQLFENNGKLECVDFGEVAIAGVLGAIPGGIGGRFLGRSLSRSEVPEYLNISGKQFSRKLNRRARELNIDPSSAKDRFNFRSRINRVFENADEVRIGKFSGQGPSGIEGEVLFFRRGRDIVVTKPNGDFVTFLPNGINSQRFQSGTPIR